MSTWVREAMAPTFNTGLCTSQISICKLLINAKCNVCVGLLIKTFSCRIKKKKNRTTSSHRVCSPGKPLVFLLQALVLPREVFPAPCTGQHDTSEVYRGWLWKKETRCFLRTKHVPQVSRVVQALFERPPSWIVRYRVQSLTGSCRDLPVMAWATRPLHTHYTPRAIINICKWQYQGALVVNARTEKNVLNVLIMMMEM